MDTNAPTPIASPDPSSEALSGMIKTIEGYGELPKKYIRTFASDMAILQSGGIPDLQPLVESGSSAPPPPPSMSSPTSAPAPASPVTPAASFQTSIPSSNIGHVSMSPLSISIGKEAIPVSPVATPVPEPSQPAAEATPLETYEGDFSNQLKESNASFATVLATEQDAAPIIPEPPPRSSRGSALYISAGITLLVVGGVGAYFAYTNYAASLAPITLAPTVSVPIFIDEREQISGVGDVLLQAIQQSTNHPLTSGEVRLLYTNDATTTDNSVFSALQLPAPNILLRNVNAMKSMAGIVNAGGNQTPFFILSVLSYGETFSGMLSWEPTMLNNLKTLFPAYPRPTPLPSIPTMVASTTATTTKAKITSATSSPIIATTTPKIVPAGAIGFRDEVINNHDVRIYRDVQGRSVMVYGYWNQTTLVIARDAAAFAEILSRLATSHTQ